VTLPPVLLFVIRHAAKGTVIDPMALLLAAPGPLIAEAEKTVGPADDGYAPDGSSMVTSICHVDERPFVLIPKPTLIGETCQLIVFQTLDPEEL
jgi:hypothetical protein